MKVGLPKVPVAKPNPKTVAVKKAVEDYASKQIRNTKSFNAEVKHQAPLVKTVQVKETIQKIVSNLVKKGK